MATVKYAYMTDSIDQCTQAVASLRAWGVEEDAISVIARGEIEEPVHPASDEFENDVVPALKRGVSTGGATGLLASPKITLV